MFLDIPSCWIAYHNLIQYTQGWLRVQILTIVKMVNSYEWDINKALWLYSLSPLRPPEIILVVSVTIFLLGYSYHQPSIEDKRKCNCHIKKHQKVFFHKQYILWKGFAAVRNEITAWPLQINTSCLKDMFVL